MRAAFVVPAVLLVVAAALAACSGGPSSTFGAPDAAAPSAPTPSGAAPPAATPAASDGAAGALVPDGWSGGSGGNEGGSTSQTLSAVHIVPADAKLTVAAGSQVTQAYKVMGVVNGAGPEVDVTGRFVFFVPDSYLVGGFPTTGDPTFTSRLPQSASDPPQQGGTVTVRAQAMNPGNALVTVTTSLRVQLVAMLTDPTGAALPANPAGLFGNGARGGDAGPSAGNDAGTPDPTRAPAIFYPNDGVMLPPNLRQLEVHWQPGSALNTLFRVSFDSAAASIDYYVRCGTVAAPGLAPHACALHLDDTGYGYLAQSNAGGGDVTLTIAGADDAGAAYGVSTPTSLRFAQEPVNGGVYYWDVTNTRIMRFDFGGTQSKPDVFIAPGDYGTSGACIGCHALSPDGTKIAASQNGQHGGQLVYVADIGKATTPPAPARSDPAYLTENGDAADHIEFASFDPAGDRFVAVYGDADNASTPIADGGQALDRFKLWFHDGTTGARIPGAERLLTFEPDHPSWSPDGTMIAMTHVGAHGTSQREYSGGIDVATFSGSTLGDPVVVVPSLVPGTNSYNPSFVPDSSFLLFSQTTCPVGQEISQACDSDVAGNLDATTWAVRPVAGATPIHLDRAGQPGVADSGKIPMDTFPRSTPFQTAQGSGVLFWFTVASQRQPGLRNRSGATQQLLWMFAVDPARILAGQDGSYPGFFLPFQDLSTSNHIAEWTQKIVSATPPPSPPMPPPPPMAPIPPPVVQ